MESKMTLTRKIIWVAPLSLLGLFICVAMVPYVLPDGMVSFDIREGRTQLIFAFIVPISIILSTIGVVSNAIVKDMNKIKFGLDYSEKTQELSVIKSWREPLSELFLELDGEEFFNDTAIKLRCNEPCCIAHLEFYFHPKRGKYYDLDKNVLVQFGKNNSYNEEEDEMYDERGTPEAGFISFDKETKIVKIAYKVLEQD